MFQVLPVESRVTGRQKPRRRETKVGRSTIDPRLWAFELEIYADRGLIDGDEAGVTVGLEFGAVLLITEAGMVPQAFEYQRKGVRIGNVEFDFLAALVNFAAGVTFICDDSVLALFRG